MRETRISVHFTRSLIRFAASRGASAEDLCRAAGLTPTQLGEPDRTIPSRRSEAVWALAERQTGDPNLGLRLGEHSHPAVFGLVGYLMTCSATLAEALEKLVRYSNLLTDGVTGRLFREADLAGVELTVADREDNFLQRAARQPVEASFATLLTVAEALTGRRPRVREVGFAHPAPLDTTEHIRIFQTTVGFGRPVSRLGFEPEILDAPVVTADPGLRAMFEARAEERLARVARAETLAERVRERLLRSVTETSPTLAAVARDLGLSERSLQRRLGEEGTTFLALLDAARRELACLHLENPAVSVAEVAFLLGFSEPSAFHRFFKRKTGETPDAFRRRVSGV